MPAGHQPAEQQSRAERQPDQEQRGLMRRAADADEEEAEATRGQGGARKIERMLCARRLRQRLQADPDGNRAERNVDREQPGPRSDRKNRRGDRRPQRERRSDHQRVVAEAAAQHMGRVDEADQRRVDAHDAARAQPLQRPRRRQAGQRPCERAAKRGQREQQQAAKIDPPMADDFAERAERQQRGDQRDLVDIDHPDHLGRTDLEVGGDGRQRDVRDRRVQRSHRQRGKDRSDRPAPEFRGQAVDWRGCGRLCGCI